MIKNVDPSTDCTFCNEEKTKATLIRESGPFFVIASFGQISDVGGYILVIPRRHVRCLAELYPYEIELLRSTVEVLKHDLTHAFGGDVLMFEYGIVGQTIPHAHLHMIPKVPPITYQIARKHIAPHFVSLESFRDLRELYNKKKKPYIFWQDPGMTSMYVAFDPDIPPMFFRIVCAERIGNTQNADWRNVDPTNDKKICEMTKEALSVPSL